jgi:N4-gp56 family major capsid protein
MANLNMLADAQKNGLYNDRYWSNRLLEMIKLERPNFVFQTLGKEVSLPKNQGTRTFSMRRYNSLPVALDSNGVPTAKLAEGTAPTPLIIEGQMVDVSVDQFGAFIKETDWVKEIHMDNIKDIYQPELSRHAAEVIERNIMSKFSEASEYFCDATSPAANDDVDDIVAADVLTFDDVRIVNLTMKNYRRSGHTKFGGHPVVVVHANVMQDLLDDSDLEDKMLVPGNDNLPIKLGSLERYMVYGFYIVETLIADVTANSSGVNVYTSYVLGKDPYAVASLGNGKVQWYSTGFKAEKTDPLGQIATFGYKLWTGAKVIDPIAITKIYSSSAYDAAIADFEEDPIGRAAAQMILTPTITIAATLAQTAQSEEDTLTATVADGDETSVTTLPEGYRILWSSSDETVCTVVADDGYLTATVTAIKATSGTATITAQIQRHTTDGWENVGDADTCAYTLTIA